VVTRYGECSALTRDSRLGHMAPDMLAFFGYPDWAEHPSLRLLFTSILLLNPPDHTRLRRLVSGTFTARRVQALRPAITAMVDDLLDELNGAGSAGGVDFVGAFAFPLPVNVIGELLGVPAPDRAQFQGLVRDWTQVLEVVNGEVLRAADPAAATIREYLAGLAAERRREPGDDLLSALVATGDAGDQLTEDELLTMAALLFAAGFETTTNLLGNGLQIILADPPAGDAVRDGSVPPPAFVDEVLRFDSPVQLTSRIGYDTVLAGVPVSTETEVVTLLGAGNRDPRRFASPGRFDPMRSDGGPLSFGGGAHFCIGAALARLEGSVAFPRLLNRFPKIFAAGEPTRRDTLVLRGFDELPVTVA
jgi:cytochrome P450